MQRSTRNILLLLGLVVTLAVGLPLIDGFAGAGGDTPHEVWGMLPAEWRQVREQIVISLLAIALIGSWIVAHVVFNRSSQYKTGTPFCAVCNYSLLGLPQDAMCPECGCAMRVFHRSASDKDRLSEVALVQVIGISALLVCLFSFASVHAGLIVFHAAMTLPVLFVAKDKRLSVSEAAFVSAVTLFTVSACIVLSMWQSTHSTDGQAAIGLLGASCSGWLFAGPGYLAAALAVYFYRRHQAKREGGTV